MNGRGHGPGLFPRIKLSARLVAKKAEKRTGGLTWRDRPVTILFVAVMSTDKTTAGAICQKAVLHRPMASVDGTKTMRIQVVHLRCPIGLPITRPHP